MRETVMTKHVQNWREKEKELVLDVLETRKLSLFTGKCLRMSKEKTRGMMKMDEQPWRTLEKRLIMDVIETRKLSMFSGKYLVQAEQCLKKIYPDKKALLLNSGTAALYIALKCLDIAPDDEVIVPAITYPATALAIVHVGAKPVFADIDPATCTLDAESCRQVITKNTKAIIFVHLFGVMGTVEQISDLCAEKGLQMIEDCAQAFGSKLKGKMTGTFGQAACFSFFETKTISAGEGGALLLNDSSKIERGRRYRHHGMDVHSGDRTVAVSGFNYKPSEFQSALILAQLTHYEKIISGRRKIALAIREAFSEIVEFQSVGPEEHVIFDKLCMFFKNSDNRKSVEKIGAELGAYRYLIRPLYREPAFTSWATSSLFYPGSEFFCDRHLVLPIPLNAKYNRKFQQLIDNITGGIG